MRLERPETGNDIFSLAMSPAEWKDVHALTLFARIGLAYDCEAPYVTQVFVYFLGMPEELQSDQDLQAAFSAVVPMAESIPADGRNRGDVTLRLPKEEMRQLLVILDLAGMAEEQADRLYNAVPEFPFRFPDLSVPAPAYAKAFEHLRMALHHDRSLVIDLKGAPNAAPGLDASKLPSELRTYLETAMTNLSTQNSEIYADDTRTLGIQTNELVDKMNSASRRQYQAATSTGDPESAPSYKPVSPVDDDELKASVEERGGTISAALTADQLRAQLSAGEWSRMTNIDPELIKAEGERQRRALTPSLRRYVLETRLAEALLTDDRIITYLQAQ